MAGRSLRGGASGSGLADSSITFRCASVNSSSIAGSTSTIAAPNTMSTALSVARCGRVVDRQILRQQILVLGDSPPPDHGGDRADRERAGTPARVATQQQHARAGHERRDDERQSVADEAVVDVAGIGAQHDDARDRERARGDRRRQRSRAEVALELGCSRAAGVVDEEHGCEVRRRGDEERADQERERISANW